ncbi:hypothetical protein EDD16DRAFT_330905 [Pisolithus croceorrhizus]|nr:hypothetical protein EDD16DRAFT_330905 [Pisolithus croceorrhizus]
MRRLSILNRIHLLVPWGRNRFDLYTALSWPSSVRSVFAQDPKHNAPVPSGSQCDEIGDTKPLPSPTGSSPANCTCTHAPSTIASCFESFEGMNSVDHHALSRDVLVDTTPYVEDSGYKEDPHAWCPQMLCLHLSTDGTRCLQVITCATVPTHLASHGVKSKSVQRIFFADGRDVFDLKNDTIYPPCS